MGNRYIIPDIHGCYLTLRHMIESILKPDLGDQLIFLGDFINKAPHSKKVLDYLMMLEKEGFNTCAAMGNHDKLLLDLYDDRINIRNFKEKGGDQTLKSFGVGLCRDIPQKYFKFIERLSPFIITGDYVIVHAGINFGADDPWKDFQSMMTSRDYHVREDQSKFKKIIHGHQASPLKDILNMVLDKSATTLNLDNGCAIRKEKAWAIYLF